LGADENENRGILIRVSGEVIWTPITSVSGLLDRGVALKNPKWVEGLNSVGNIDSSEEAMSIEVDQTEYLVWVEEIQGVSTRLEAVQRGAVRSFKDYLQIKSRRIA